MPDASISLHQLLSNRLPTEELKTTSLFLWPFFNIGKAFLSASASQSD